MFGSGLSECNTEAPGSVFRSIPQLSDDSDIAVIMDSGSSLSITLVF